ncbi:peptide ABC transporter substrate-binding protein [Christensenellaceae bacterium NSJ-44]|uniref:Peptide ABC transporter substrate-binding protein n=1 Tax=Luoshenia tenuis TaxID=2763654 RepID=A0A926D232_9FIRM|nr:peptide ABC transporter substrate-binding protein [Luoshenia tenuis]MBC8530079.1 peptide ABC transporter substrate-binding protein [Luoshenia tenuis]
MPKAIWKRMALVMTCALLLVCGCAPQQATPSTSAQAPSPSPTPGPESGVLPLTLGTLPDTLDPAKASSQNDAIYCLQLFEGLTSVDAAGDIVPGIAQDWTISEDQLTWTFSLREANWSDGTPVTAQDFVYAWQRAADPGTQAQHAYLIRQFIKNGSEVNDGTLPVTDLGVQADGERTLVVTLKQPYAGFDAVVALPLFLPLRQDMVDSGDRWAREGESLLCNGPFVLDSWEKDRSLVLLKNSAYYAAETVLPQKLDFAMITDDQQALTAFTSRQILISRLYPIEKTGVLAQAGMLQRYPQISTAFLSFNCSAAPFDNTLVRKALALAIDREKLCSDALFGAVSPAGGYIPAGVRDLASGNDFRSDGGDLFPVDSEQAEASIQQAQQLLAQAGYPEGNGLPEIELIYLEDMNPAALQAVQAMWEDNLGLQVALVPKSLEAFSQARREGTFQVCLTGWAGDYGQPSEFFDLFLTDSVYNSAKWSNADYDSAIATAKETADAAAAMQAYHAAENILLEDAAISPLFFYNEQVLVDPAVQGLVVSPAGYHYYKFVSVE